MVQVGKQGMVGGLPEIIVNSGILITLELEVLYMKHTKTRKGDRLPCVSTGVFTGPILGRVGAPPTLMAGGLLCCVGCIGSSLAPNIYVLIVCFGVLTGIVFVTIVCFAVQTGIVFVTIVCFGVLTGIVFVTIVCFAVQTGVTIETLPSFTPRLLSVYRNKSLYCKYTQHILFTHSFYGFIRVFISVTVSSKTTKRILNIYFSKTITRCQIICTSTHFLNCSEIPLN